MPSTTANRPRTAAFAALRQRTGQIPRAAFAASGSKQAPALKIDADTFVPHPPHFLPSRAENRLPAPRTAQSVADFAARRRQIILIIFPTSPSWRYDSRALSGAPIVPLPRNRLASSATGGASPISMRVGKILLTPQFTVVALRFPRPSGRANRATSSKPARFIRHRRRFADFRARLRRVRCRGAQPPQKREAGP